jgi:hypothetical protein
VTDFFKVEMVGICEQVVVMVGIGKQSVERGEVVSINGEQQLETGDGESRAPTRQNLV